MSSVQRWQPCTTHYRASFVSGSAAVFEFALSDHNARVLSLDVTPSAALQHWELVPAAGPSASNVGVDKPIIRTYMHYGIENKIDFRIAWECDISGTNVSLPHMHCLTVGRETGYIGSGT
eukprot:GABW01000292.1.p1 GENE.GABW01000292.1~~GABW01000292.1.p1  ORF type:complete len:120 (+),score=3.52 GABW01000292.1:79-438(+)